MLYGEVDENWMEDGSFSLYDYLGGLQSIDNLPSTIYPSHII